MQQIHRIRKNYKPRNGNIYVFLADVISDDIDAILEAANLGQIRNWKWVDKIEKPGVEYPPIEYLHRIRRREAKDPQEPGNINLQWQR